MSGTQSRFVDRLVLFVNHVKKTTFFSTLLPPGSFRKYLAGAFYRKIIPILVALQEPLDVPHESIDPAMQNTEHFLAVSRHAGFPLAPGARILDFGCGAGVMVRLLVERGYDALGYDIMDYRDESSQALAGRFAFLGQGHSETGNHVIDWDGFTLPYPDNSFDTVFTSQVLEHVMRHDLIFCELARVMKPGAASINIFPPRNYPVEQHIRVPFGYHIHNKTYYYIMAKLGCRNQFQKDLSPRAIADVNYRYVRDGLNYLSNRELIRLASRYFNNVRIDLAALYYKDRLSPVFHKYLEHFGKTICLVMADKKI